MAVCHLALPVTAPTHLIIMLVLELLHMDRKHHVLTEAALHLIMMGLEHHNTKDHRHRVVATILGVLKVS